MEGGQALEVIRLQNVGGMERLCGWDQSGRHWVECYPDYGVPDCGTIRCSLCGRVIVSDTAAWLCTLSGEVLCDDHIVY
jgi:hypothetical protein